MIIDITHLIPNLETSYLDRFTEVQEAESFKEYISGRMATEGLVRHRELEREFRRIICRNCGTVFVLYDKSTDLMDIVALRKRRRR